MIRFRAVHVAIALSAFAFSACSSDDDPDVLTVTPTTLSLDAGQTQQLVAELRTAEGTPVSGATYAWSSSLPAIAKVSSTGLVTAVTGGSAMITVSSAGQSKSVPVAVTSAATTILVAPSTVTLMQGGVENLVVAVYDENGAVMSGAAVTFTPSSSIATVNSVGVVTASGAGQGVITVASGAASYNVQLVFTGHPAGVPGPRLTLGSRPFGVAVGADSTLLVTQLDAGAMGKGRTDLATFPASVPVGSVPTSVAIGPGPTSAYVANQLSHSIGVVDVPSGVQATFLPVPGDPFRVIVGYGPFIFASTNIDSVFMLNTTTLEIMGRGAVGLDPNGMALRHDGTALYVSNMSSGDVSELNLGTFTVSRTFSLGGVPQDVVISPDDSELYVANEGGLLQVVDLGGGTVTAGGAGTGNLFGLALSPDGKVLVGTRPGSGQVVVIDRVTRQVVSTVTTGGTPRRVSMDLLGSIAAVANEQGWVDLIR